MSTVKNILTNEKYKGDTILQKTYCTDYQLKIFVVNDGSAFYGSKVWHSTDEYRRAI